jgi:hypothetical protein
VCIPVAISCCSPRLPCHVEADAVEMAESGPERCCRCGRGPRRLHIHNSRTTLRVGVWPPSPADYFTRASHVEFLSAVSAGFVISSTRRHALSVPLFNDLYKLGSDLLRNRKAKILFEPTGLTIRVTFEKKHGEHLVLAGHLAGFLIRTVSVTGFQPPVT